MDYQLMGYELVDDLRSGRLTLPEYLMQVEMHFGEHEPSIMSFVPEHGRFERLRKDAGELILQYPDLHARPPLFGALVGIKDIFHVEGFTTQAGSRLPADRLQGSEAESVTRLRNAGALLLGKTATTEFAYFSPASTRNPHNPEHTPGGSSSGSAAGVAAGFCHLALGTQTIGSIIRPASFCGVVGLKPTYDRISREGVIPLAPSLDHVGFFAADVPTAIHAARALYKDWDEPITLDGRPILGIPEGPYLRSASDYALSWFDAISASLADAGYEIRRVPVMDDYQNILDRNAAILSAEVAQVHSDWFRDHEELYSPQLYELIRRGQNVSDLRSQLDARDRFRESMIQTMKDNHIDLWICPSAVDAAPKGLESTGDPVMNLPWTQAGLPVMSLPAVKNPDGMPMGLQLVGNWYRDESLLFWAKELANALDTI